tara:strand:+ start:1261 stop:1890 length:630 start_codon:yes stop_codon:yes gene_type:complete
MNVSEVLKIANPVMPVMVIDDLASAVPLAQALVNGGVKTLEITLRTPVALDAVKQIASEVEGAIVGVGTVVNAEQLQAAKDAGATFAVSPGFTTDLGKAAQDIGLELLPGVANASDIVAALSIGLDHLKFFPAEQAGGIPMLKALGGPFPQITFCPTGGINVNTAKDYLALPNVACVGGSWLAPKDKVIAGDWAAITQIAKDAQALKTA